MKIFIPLICVVSLAFAEPPVDEGYPSARSKHSHDHVHEHDHNNDFQRSLTQEYGPPSIESARSFHENDLSREYLPPNARSSNFKSSLSQTYGSPNTRSRTSESGIPNLRSSIPSKGLSTKYGVPTTRSGSSQRNSASETRSVLSQEYGVPSVRSGNAKSPSAQYDVPEVHTQSEEYEVPAQRNFDSVPSQKSGSPKARISQSSGIHLARSGKIQDYSSPRTSAKSFASSNSRSSKVSPKFRARSSLTSFGSQTAKSSYSQDTLSYRTPNQHDLSFEVPSARGISQEYGVPVSYAAKQKTSTVASQDSTTDRSAPSNTYGAPSVRDSMPSEQYGVPDQYSNLSKKGYSNARSGLNDALNEEPASYDFSYKVEDYESGSDFGHTETRQDNRAEGAYFVVLPDGTKQVVEYEADELGFKPRISVEPADFARTAEHDDNAAEITRSTEGPY